MIFVYPALISDKIDRRYFPGIIKTMELYFLQNIAEAASSGVLSFYTVQGINGKFSPIQLESKQGIGDYEPMNIIYEDDRNQYDKTLDQLNTKIQEVEKKLKDANTAIANAKKELLGLESDHDYDFKSKDVDPEILRQRQDLYNIIDENESKKEIATKELQALYQDRGKTQLASDTQKQDKTKPDKPDISHAATGGASVKVDTTSMMDLRPTSLSIDVNVRVQKSKWLGLSKDLKYEDKRQIPISVKVVPMIIKNAENFYSVLIDDIYSNKYSSTYRSAVRWFAGKANNWGFGILRKALSLNTPTSEVDVWRDILLSPKGFVDASSFRNADRGPEFSKYSAAIVIMSNDDIRHQEQNFFDDVNKMQKLYKMGWNTFCIANDADQTLIFCSYYENGACAKIPYQYLFHSLKATDLYKELEQLGGFNRRIIGSFNKGSIKRLSESINVRNEVESKIKLKYNYYMNIIKESIRSVK